MGKVSSAMSEMHEWKSSLRVCPVFEQKAKQIQLSAQIKNDSCGSISVICPEIDTLSAQIKNDFVWKYFCDLP